MTGIHKLIAQVMYGGGLRIMECLRLRVTPALHPQRGASEDIDFDNRQIVVRGGKACPEPVEGATMIASPSFPIQLPLR
jgi:hypothetical protein